MEKPTPVPRCIMCGEPARIVLIKKHYIRCELDKDGSIGKVISLSREPSSIHGYECGGGHKWLTDKS